MTTQTALDESRPPVLDDVPRPSAREDTAYFFGVRGVTAISIMTFHCDLMVHYLPHHVGSRLYDALTTWLRYGDFRVVPFFIMSGYLLTLPTTRAGSWPLSRGLAGFFKRRVERVVYPYYWALGVSLTFFVAWRIYVGFPLHILPLAGGLLAHVLLVHNLHPLTTFYINDTLWSVALEFQCYVLMALLFFPAMRRTGIWAPLIVIVLSLAFGFGQRTFFHDFFDTTRPWYIVLFAFGMAAAALRNRAFPIFGRIERAVPWGVLWVALTVAGAALTISEGPDPPYFKCWPSVLVLGLAFSSFIIYLRGPKRGFASHFAKPVVALLELPALGFLGRFSYSVYLTHFPIYRLLLAVVARYTDSLWIQGGLGLFVFTPVCLAIAYAFHVKFERPGQKPSPELPPKIAVA
jgi:peptidoglycan/LPS O-acetylase OafA/YrhL